MDSVVCFVNTYPLDSDLSIYTVDSVIQPLNNRGPGFFVESVTLGLKPEKDFVRHDNETRSQELTSFPNLEA